MKIASSLEIKNIDKQAFRKYQISDIILMENAGRSMCNIIKNYIKVNKKNFLIFCGTGNNGGDGFVVARQLYSNGYNIKLIIIGDYKKFSVASKNNFTILKFLGLYIRHISLISIDDIINLVNNCDIIIDAILGTGIKRNIDGILSSIILLINHSKKTIFSIDIPSGINSDTGQIMGIAIKAHYTLSLGLPKIGNILYPGFEYCGKLYLSHISLPPELYNNEEIKININLPVIIPDRFSDSYKKEFGEVLFIAGSANYIGAPYFSAYAFLKAGGGYSRLATPASIASLIASMGPEIVIHPQLETKNGSISYQNKNFLIDLANKMDMVIIGPGLSLEKEVQKLVQELLLKLEVPVLIDGDGISAIALNPSILKIRKAQTILTPHKKEISRLSGIDLSIINQEKIKIISKLTQKFNSIIVLKGAHTIISYPNDDQIFINITGNSGLAKAGTGDVLNGIIAAMFGLGLSIEKSVRMGVLIHGLAGDLSMEKLGKDGFLAQDIINNLPKSILTAREMSYQNFQHFYGIEEI